MFKLTNLEDESVTPNKFSLEAIKCGNATGCEDDKEINWFLNEVTFALYKVEERLDYIEAREDSESSKKLPLYRRDAF
jgi:hypothetical protein